MQKLKTLILSLFLFSLFQIPVSAQLDFRRVCAHQNGNDIELSWAQPSNPCANFLSISIFGRLNNLTPYSFIDSISNINQLNYVHTNAATQGETWSYFMVFRYLCDNSSSNSDTLFLDFNQPNISTLDSISYDPLSGYWKLGWSSNPAPDLLGYIVWDSLSGNNIPLDSIFGLSYTDSSSNPLSGASSYKLSAYDSCINQSIISLAQTPIFLSLNQNKCGTTNTLNWNPYIGQKNVRYEIYSKMGDSEYILENTVFPPTTSYSFKLQSGDTIEYFIRVQLSNGASSRSNPVSIIATDLYPNDSNYIEQVSWTSSNEFTIKTLHPISNLWDSVYLERTYEKSSLLIFGNISSQNKEVYLDLMPDTSQYYYTQIMVDNCGRRYRSLSHKNIVLKSKVSTNDTYLLSWNSYTNWDKNVSDYQINLGEDLAEYSTWNTLQNQFPDTTDQIYIDNTALNIRCFQIKAIEDGPNKYGLNALSYSNPVCHIQEPSIYFPNAFVPNGINNTYLPVGLSIDKTKSNIKIYSRTGQKLWDNNLNDAWTGYSQDGKPYQDASFLYYAVIYFLNGDKQTYKGNITVLY